MSDINLTGRWVGHYVERGRECPIEANLTQDGDELRGWMRDTVTEIEISIFDLAVDAGLPPGADEEITRKLRESVPDAGDSPVRWVSTLPDQSVLEGEIEQNVVRITKTYQGETSGGYKVGDTFVGEQHSGHQVLYEGHYDPDANTINGTWRIEADPENHSVRTEGQFCLRRD